jgi:hypothetical protein
MILKLSDRLTVNLLQACYWEVVSPLVAGGQPCILITFLGETDVRLTPEETVIFEETLKRMRQPKLVQPAGAIIAP